MRLYFTLWGFVLLLIFSCQLQRITASQKPNILVFLIEELNFETLPVYGNSETRVPHIHHLSQESHVFKSAYVTQPVCTPSRGSLLTGKYPHNGPLTYNNAWSDIYGGVDGRYIVKPEILSQIVPFTEYLPRDLIKTCYIGKWHIGPERTHANEYFDEYWSIIHKFRESADEPHTSYNKWLQDKGITPDQPDGTFGYKRMVKMAREFSRLTFMEEKAMDFISKNEKDPWVLFFSPHEVHTPNTGPYDGLFSTKDVSLDSAHYVLPDENSPVRHHIRATKWSSNLKTEQKKDELARYYGKLYDVDKTIGTIIDHLKETGQYDNTTIIFTADHGSMVNRKGFQTKMVMFDHSSRVPFIVKLPGQKALKLIETPISLIDLLPTIFDLLSIEQPNVFDGKSLVPVMEGMETPSPVVVQWNPIHSTKWDKTFGQSKIRSMLSEARFKKVISQKIRCWVDPSGYKLVLTDQYNDKNQLYNLNEDPLELKNIYYENGYREKIKIMESKLLTWQSKNNDTIQLSLIQ